MQVSQFLKDAAALVGFHVVRNYQNPAHTMMGLLKHDFGTVLDVGANRGQFAQWIRKRLPDAEYHCFEPLPEAFTQLKAWASTSGGGRVHAINRALGDTAGAVAMNCHTEHSTSSSLLATTAHCESELPFTAAQNKVMVRVERLDDYMSSLAHRPRPDWLLKIDVQGFEAPVLRGAPTTLEHVRACIIEVSLDEFYVGQSNFTEIVSLLAAAGLHYAGNFQQMYGHDGRVMWLDAMFTRR